MNGVIVVNKPEGFTSHDVVAKLRGILKTRRIGHSGTLDPMATGVLPIFVGRATRACEFATADNKTYRAEMLLGVETDTQDITGTVLAEKVVNVSDEALFSTVNSFLGEISQIPPMYSAIKVDGKKLYELARRGVEVERKARKITVHSIKAERLSENTVAIEANVSKGTYIRTLCHDIGKALGCGATLTKLCRVSSGAFTLEDAYTLDEIQEKGSALIRPVDSLFAEFSKVKVDEKGTFRIKNGAAIPFDGEDGKYRVYSEDGEFLMLGEIENNILKTIKSFFEV